MKEYKETQHSLIYKSNTDLSFYSAGYEDCLPGYHYGPKYRSYDLIHFVLKVRENFISMNTYLSLLLGMLLSFLQVKFLTMRLQLTIPGAMHGSAILESAHRLTHTNL